MEVAENFINDRKRMCAFSNKGQMMMAGGDRISSNSRRLFVVNENKVEQLEDLPFDFQEGFWIDELTSQLIQLRTVCRKHWFHERCRLLR